MSRAFDDTGAFVGDLRAAVRQGIDAVAGIGGVRRIKRKDRAGIIDHAIDAGAHGIGFERLEQGPLRVEDRVAASGDGVEVDRLSAALFGVIGNDRAEIGDCHIVVAELSLNVVIVRRQDRAEIFNDQVQGGIRLVADRTTRIAIDARFLQGAVVDVQRYPGRDGELVTG